MIQTRGLRRQIPCDFEDKSFNFYTTLIAYKVVVNQDIFNNGFEVDVDIFAVQPPFKKELKF